MRRPVFVVEFLKLSTLVDKFGKVLGSKLSTSLSSKKEVADDLVRCKLDPLLLLFFEVQKNTQGNNLVKLIPRGLKIRRPLIQPWRREVLSWVKSFSWSPNTICLK